MSTEKIRQLLTSLDTIEAALIQAENKAEYLVNEIQALRDVQRSAQYLVDIIHTQGAGTSGGPFQIAYDNLREALKHYYLPNGARTPQTR